MAWHQTGDRPLSEPMMAEVADSASINYKKATNCLAYSLRSYISLCEEMDEYVGKDNINETWGLFF